MPKNILSKQLSSLDDLRETGAVQQKLYKMRVGRRTEGQYQVRDCWYSGRILDRVMDKFVPGGGEARAICKDVGDVLDGVPARRQETEPFSVP